MCYEIGLMFYVQLPIDNYAITVIVCYFEIEFFAEMTLLLHMLWHMIRRDLKLQVPRKKITSVGPLIPAAAIPIQHHIELSDHLLSQ